MKIFPHCYYLIKINEAFSVVHKVAPFCQNLTCKKFKCLKNHKKITKKMKIYPKFKAFLPQNLSLDLIVTSIIHQKEINLISVMKINAINHCGEIKSSLLKCAIHLFNSNLL